jgi:hypothetical protein
MQPAWLTGGHGDGSMPQRRYKESVLGISAILKSEFGWITSF